MYKGVTVVDVCRDPRTFFPFHRPDPDEDQTVPEPEMAQMNATIRCVDLPPSNMPQGTRCPLRFGNAKDKHNAPFIRTCSKKFMYLSRGVLVSER
ncbi:hypothetical protein RUM43_001795 [Polyplax serrata]|uniref:Uncharacterized protein n=1 Tax=Polyplax serrata TaxID=468196 RepID=A0AAN8XQD8_POLSC